MRIIKTTIAVLLLGMFATSAYADLILAVDADAGTAGIQNSLTVNVGDTFSLFTVVTADTGLRSERPGFRFILGTSP